MYKVKIPKEIHNKIFNFIDNYKIFFIKSFNDSWIYYEDLIIENYVKNSKKFQREIYFSMRDILQEEKIIAYKPLENNKFMITIKVLNYRLFVEYSEDNNDKLRFVENISFNKK